MTRLRWIVGIVLLLLLTLACTIFLGGPAYPTQTVPVSTAAVQTLRAQVATATLEAAQGGRLTLQLTQEQLTSLLNARLQGKTDTPVKEPLVLLHPDVIEFYGKVQQGNFVSNVKLVLAVTVSADGKPQFQITEAYLGPLPLPQTFRETVATMLNEAYLGAIGPAATGFRLENIVIGEGVMTITGRIR
ncbi:MAG: hypothetical protein WHS87_09260 [Anaerolineales bacterium]